MSNDEEMLVIRETVAKFVDRELIPIEDAPTKLAFPSRATREA